MMGVLLAKWKRDLKRGRGSALPFCFQFGLSLNKLVWFGVDWIKAVCG